MKLGDYFHDFVVSGRTTCLICGKDLVVSNNNFIEGREARHHLKCENDEHEFCIQHNQSLDYVVCAFSWEDYRFKIRESGLSCYEVWELTKESSRFINSRFIKEVGGAGSEITFEEVIDVGKRYVKFKVFE